MLANMAGIELQPYKPGSAGKAVVGYNIKIFNEAGDELGPNKEGFIVAKLPLPPGTLSGLWQNQTRFEESYLSQFPGYYFTGDGGYQDENGNIWVTGRVDDVINVAGHRLSTSEMEEVVSQHPEVAECAVVGIEDTLKGQIPAGFVILKNGSEMEHFQLQHEIVHLIRNQIGAVAALKNIIVVEKLPKTRSGKTLRKLLRDIVDGKKYQIPSTIDDESSVPHLIEVLENYKIGAFK